MTPSEQIKLLREALSNLLNGNEPMLDDKLAREALAATEAAPVESGHDADKRIAPVQGYMPGIPWAMHLRAYDTYCALGHRQQALIQGDCRGGFDMKELDMLIPGWREELSELHQLLAEVDRLRNAAPVPHDAVVPDVAKDLRDMLASVNDALGFYLYDCEEFPARIRKCQIERLERSHALVKAFDAAPPATLETASAVRQRARLEAFDELDRQFIGDCDWSLHVKDIIRVLKVKP